MLSLLCDNRFEHPAGNYKKIFETCEELAEALPTTVTGLFFHMDLDNTVLVYLSFVLSIIECIISVFVGFFLQEGFLHFWREVFSVWDLDFLKLEMSLSITSLMARPSCINSTSRTAKSPTSISTISRTEFHLSIFSLCMIQNNHNQAAEIEAA